MQGENVLQIHLKGLPEIDWQNGSRHIRCPRGRVVIEMAPFEKKRGLIHLPDKVAGNERPDVGIVLSAGSDTGLRPGDAVVVRAYDGTWRTDFEAGTYKAKGEVRCYGVYGAAPGECELYDWSDSVLALLDNELNMTPLKRNLLVKRDPTVKQEGLIHLSDNSVYRTNIGTIVSAGPDSEFSVGTRVLYNPNAMLQIDMIEGDPDLGVCSDDAIEAIIVPDEVALAA